MNDPTIRRSKLTLSQLVFDVALAGEQGRPLVLLLHGFPQTSHTWRHALPALAAAGYLAAAPNQRGYSPGARPPAVSDYATDLLVADALQLASQLGSERFHLVGHDWGGQLAWLIAARHPERVLTLSVLSRPHPAAFVSALKQDGAQAERSRHHRAFQDPDTAQRLLEDDGRRLRRTLTEQGVSQADATEYLRELAQPSALDAALNWYRAAVGGGAVAETSKPARVPAIQVPTLYVWGDADATVGRSAAEATASHVNAPYRFEVIAGAGHFLTDQAGEQIARLLLAHVSSV
jgi:pimeloyl-ACP methyl ester carboxylesterase